MASPAAAKPQYMYNHEPPPKRRVVYPQSRLGTSRSPSSESRGDAPPSPHTRLAGWRAMATLRPSKGADKNLGSIFLSGRLSPDERLETGQGLDLADRPLKQPVISLRPGSYGERGGSRGVCRGSPARFVISFSSPQLLSSFSFFFDDLFFVFP